MYAKPFLSLLPHFLQLKHWKPKSVVCVNHVGENSSCSTLKTEFNEADLLRTESRAHLQHINNSDLWPQDSRCYQSLSAHLWLTLYTLWRSDNTYYQAESVSARWSRTPGWFMVAFPPLFAAVTPKCSTLVVFFSVSLESVLRYSLKRITTHFEPDSILMQLDSQEVGVSPQLCVCVTLHIQWWG